MSHKTISNVAPLPLLPQMEESATVRKVFLGLALFVTVIFSVIVFSHHAPGLGNPGVDENAYLVAGTNFAHHLQFGLHPNTPYAYVGPMWIRADSGWYYPKYPCGVPILNAIAIWLSGGHNFAATVVSPLCATLAVLGTFLLTRLLAGSFMALLATIAMAANPTLLQLALVPSSHAPAVCFVVWGMYALLCWWKQPSIIAGVAAGLILGCTASIRYSEALLLLPLALAAITTIDWRRRQSYVQAAIPLLAWALPVAALLIFNRLTMGHWTGYDSTNESEGFGLNHFAQKWEMTIQQLNTYGLFLLLPMGVLGMLLMLAKSWRIGLWMLLWFVPGVLLYMAYYWTSPGLSYLRFFLTFYPAVIASAMWFLAMTIRGLMADTHSASSPHRRIVAANALVCLFIVALAACGLYTALPQMHRQLSENGNMAYSAQQFIDVLRKEQPASAQPLLIGEDGGFGSRQIMYMQFAVDGEWYAANAFTRRGARMSMGPPGGGPGGPRPAERDGQQNDAYRPTVFDPARSAYLTSIYDGMSDRDLAREETRVYAQALAAGRAIYAIVSPTAATSLCNRLTPAGFACQTLASWREPLNPPDPNRPGGQDRRGPDGQRDFRDNGGGPGFGPPGGGFDPNGGPPGPPDGGPGGGFDGPGPGGGFNGPGPGGLPNFDPQDIGGPPPGMRNGFGRNGGNGPPGRDASPQSWEAIQITLSQR